MTMEANGPSMAQTLAAIDTVMATRKVAVCAIVSVWTDGEGGDIALNSGVTRHPSPVTHHPAEL